MAAGQSARAPGSLSVSGPVTALRVKVCDTSVTAVTGEVCLGATLHVPHVPLQGLLSHPGAITVSNQVNNSTETATEPGSFETLTIVFVVEGELFLSFFLSTSLSLSLLHVSLDASLFLSFSFSPSLFLSVCETICSACCAEKKKKKTHQNLLNETRSAAAKKRSLERRERLNPRLTLTLTLTLTVLSTAHLPTGPFRPIQSLLLSLLPGHPLHSTLPYTHHHHRYNDYWCP